MIQSVTLSNSPMFHMSFSGSKGNTTVQGVTVLSPSSSASPQPSHNTDACDVSGTNVLVQNCNISVGDDDFTCSGGTHDVLLTNNIYGNGHGISIGSYTERRCLEHHRHQLHDQRRGQRHPHQVGQRPRRPGPEHLIT